MYTYIQGRRDDTGVQCHEKVCHGERDDDEDLVPRRLPLILRAIRVWERCLLGQVRVGYLGPLKTLLGLLPWNGRELRGRVHRHFGNPLWRQAKWSSDCG